MKATGSAWPPKSPKSSSASNGTAKTGAARRATPGELSDPASPRVRRPSLDMGVVDAGFGSKQRSRRPSDTASLASAPSAAWSDPASPKEPPRTPPKTPPKQRLTVQVCMRLRPEIMELDAPAPEPSPPPSPAQRAAPNWRADAERERKRAEDERAVNERPAVAYADSGKSWGRYNEKDNGCCSYRGQRFRFKHVFPPECSTRELYEAAHARQVLGVLRGYDNTIMVYGQTGSGKSHTMFGSGGVGSGGDAAAPSPTGTPAEPGLVQRSVAALFEQMAQRAVRDGTSFSVTLSVLEILEERCVDLLHGRNPVALMCAKGGGLVFHGLTEVPVASEKRLLRLLAAAMHARTIAPNYRHDHSTRAHTIVRVRVESAKIVRIGGSTPPTAISIAPAAAAAPPAAAPPSDKHAAALAAAKAAAAQLQLGRSKAAHKYGWKSPELAVETPNDADADTDAVADADAAAVAKAVPKAGDDDDDASLAALDAAADAADAQAPAPVAVAPANGGGDNLSCTLSDATSATLTLVDLAGSEAATLNAQAATVQQGVAVNKSLHWLRCVVHDIVGHRPPQFRNSALTRLLRPSLSGYAAVSVLVTAPARPGVDSARETLETMQFGEAAGRVPLERVKRRTETSAEGKLSKLQALLAQMADEKAELADDTQKHQRQVLELQEQLDGYNQTIEQYRRDFVSAETLREAELQAEMHKAELDEAHQRNEGLLAALHEEQTARNALQLQLAEAEAEAEARGARSAALQAQIDEASHARHELAARVSAAREQQEAAQRHDAARAGELREQRQAGDELREQAESMEAALAESQRRNEALRRDLEREHAGRAEAARQVASAEAQAQQEAARTVELEGAVAEAEQQQIELRRRMQAAREAMEQAQAQCAQSEAELAAELATQEQLREHVGALEEETQRYQRELQHAHGEQARLQDLSQAKGDLLLLKHKLHRERISSIPRLATPTSATPEPEHRGLD